MTLIIYVAVFILIISAIWIWHNLGNINKNKKIVFIKITSIFGVYNHKI